MFPPHPYDPSKAPAPESRHVRLARLAHKLARGLWAGVIAHRAEGERVVLAESGEAPAQGAVERAYAEASLVRRPSSLSVGAAHWLVIPLGGGEVEDARKERTTLVVVAPDEGEADLLDALVELGALWTAAGHGGTRDLYTVAARQLPSTALLMFDRTLRYVLADGPALFATVGLSREALLGHRVGDHSPEPGPIQALCWAALEGTESTARIERDGKVFAVRVSPVREPTGEIRYGLLVAFDDTRRTKEESALRVRANHDPMTGLLNRAGFMEAFRGALAPGRSCGRLLFADMDGLKWINDTLGHQAGDEALVAAAVALRDALRSSDLVGRLGGDEFVGFIPGAEPDDTTLVTRIRDSLARVNEGRITPVSLSLGLVSCPAGADAEERLAAADEAMFHDKRQRNAGRS